MRYVLPIHLTDNVFGDTAIYEDIYNLVNRKENNFFWSIGCAAEADEVGFQSKSLPAILNAIIARWECRCHLRPRAAWSRGRPVPCSSAT